jgi:hypothetical protein
MPKLKPIALGVALAMLAGSAHAVSFFTGTLSSDVTGFTDWANACDPFGACAQPAPPAATLAVWGHEGDSLNSVRTLTYSGSSSYLLQEIKLTLGSESLGSLWNNAYFGGPPDAGSANPAVGGTVAWESPSTDNIATRLFEQYLSVTVQRGGSTVGSIAGAMFPELLDPYDNFFFELDNGFPVAFKNLAGAPGSVSQAGTEVLVQPSDTLTFRFYAPVTVGGLNAGGALPEAVFAPIGFALNGALAAAALTVSTMDADGTVHDPGTSVDLGVRRVGSGTGTVPNTNTGSVTATNTGNAGPLVGSFLAVGGANPLQFVPNPAAPNSFSLAVDESESNDYTFKAVTSLGGSTTGVISNASVQVDSGAGQVDVALTGTTVGPVFDMSGAGLVENNPADYSFDFGDVVLGNNELATFALANLFAGTIPSDLTLTALSFLGATGLSGTPFSTISATTNDPFDWNFEIDAGAPAVDFRIRFNPAAVGPFSADLILYTDEDAMYQADGNDIVIHLTGSGTGGGGVPVPGTILLMALGALGIGATRRRLG